MMWKLGAAAKPGEISSSEWNKGCESLNLSSVDDLKKLLPALDTGFLDPSEFRKFFKFVFQFSRYEHCLGRPRKRLGMRINCVRQFIGRAVALV